MRGKAADQKTIAALYRRLISRGFEIETAKAIADKYRGGEDE